MIRITDVTKTYKVSKNETVSALKHVNLHIEKPGVYLLQGPSGSGKSTLLSIIGAMLRPSEGSVEVLGKQIAKLPDIHATHFRREHLGFVFQSYNLIPELTALENVMLPLIPEERSYGDATKKAMEALDFLSLQEKHSTVARYLSGGEKQRVAIARAMVHKPKLILADEPTANLDKANKTVFQKEMERLKQLGMTILIATHDPAFENWQTVDHCFMMQDGCIMGES